MPFPYPLVIFDLDGTLVDSAADIAEAVNRSLTEWKLPTFDQARIESWIGEGSRKLITRAFREAGSTVDIDQVMDGFLLHYGQTLLLQAHAYPGVVEVLAALRAQGAKLAVCTNKPSRFVAPLLQHLGLEGYFDALIGGDSLPERKPSPLPLQHLAARFGQASEQCLMVGDSASDLHAAQAAAMPVVLVSYGYKKTLDLHSAGALAVIDDMRELLELSSVEV